MAKLSIEMSGTMLVVPDNALYAKAANGTFQPKKETKMVTVLIPDLRAPAVPDWDEGGAPQALRSSHSPVLLVPSQSIDGAPGRLKDGTIYLDAESYDVFALNKDSLGLRLEEVDEESNKFEIVYNDTYDMILVPHLQILDAGHAEAKKSLETTFAEPLIGRAKFSYGKLRLSKLDQNKWTLVSRGGFLRPQKQIAKDVSVGNTLSLELVLTKACTIVFNAGAQEKVVLLKNQDAQLKLLNMELESLVFQPKVAKHHATPFQVDTDMQAIYSLTKNSDRAGQLGLFKPGPKLNRTEKVCAPVFAEGFK